MSQEPKRQPQMVDRASMVSFTLRDLLVYFLRLGTLGFGGPIALAGHMQKDLVEERRWVSKQDYLEGLAFSQLSPGPLAAQLAMYLGWLRAGAVGAPPYFIVVVAAPYYRRFAQNRQVKAFVQGVTAAAVGAIAGAAYILARRSLVDLPTVLIGLIALAILMLTKKIPEPIVILAAGAAGVLLHGTVR